MDAMGAMAGIEENLRLVLWNWCLDHLSNLILLCIASSSLQWLPSCRVWHVPTLRPKARCHLAARDTFSTAPSSRRAATEGPRHTARPTDCCHGHHALSSDPGPGTRSHRRRGVAPSRFFTILGAATLHLLLWSLPTKKCSIGPTCQNSMPRQNGHSSTRLRLSSCKPCQGRHGAGDIAEEDPSCTFQHHRQITAIIAQMQWAHNLH
mmetsp:Transcript_21355/g.35372  ORF Transcript_21355/g.35372 Transcript_21355/m.35372 type:complete len:207 (+) Transcript_21355:922-1542(+)